LLGGPGGKKTSAKTGDIKRNAKERASIVYILFDKNCILLFFLYSKMSLLFKNSFTP
jgi:hypothetical protein